MPNILLFSVSDSTAVTDSIVAAVSNPNVAALDSTAVIDGTIFGFQYLRAIRCNHGLCGNSNSVNFPVYIHLSDPTIKSVANGGHVNSSTGADVIFFADSQGVTQLPTEIENYDPVNGILDAWVQVPTLSYTADTFIFMAYGTTSPPSRTTNPWDTNFKAVWHFPNGTTLTVNDSTSNGNNVVTNSNVSAAAGLVDGAAFFDGSNSQLDFGIPASLQITNNITMSCWVKTPGTGNTYQGLIHNQWDSTANGISLIIANSPNVLFMDIGNGSSTNDPGVACTTNDNNWHFCVMTFASGVVTFYLDGVQINQQTISQTVVGYGGIKHTVVGNGSGNNTAEWLDGLMDEARISNVVRSADWVKAEYSNQSSPSIFLGISSEVSLANPKLALHFQFVVSDSTAVTDTDNLAIVESFSVSDSTAVTDSVAVQVSNPNVVVSDSTAVGDVGAIATARFFLNVFDSSAVTDSFFKDRPLDRCIAMDDLTYNAFPGLFEYSGVLYQFTDGLFQFGPGPSFNAIQTLTVRESQDHGQTWVPVAGFSGASGNAEFSFSTSAAALIGTKLYFIYSLSLSENTALAYFDFTTLTFSNVSATSLPFVGFDQIFMAAVDANHIFLVRGVISIQIGEIVSGAYSLIGTITVSGSGYESFYVEAAFVGSSGILHIFYTASVSGSLNLPVDLWYVNVISGVLGTPQKVMSNYSDGNPGGGSLASAGQLIQIGSSIYFSFYLPSAQAVQMMTFGDVSSPTFTVSTIDTSWPLTTSANYGTGSWISQLAYYGSTLYCFYSNYSNNGAAGDGYVYYRTSLSLGSSWSARTAGVLHIDPATLSPDPIWQPNVIQVVGGGSPSNSPFLTSWETA